jgi:hypothetical protein
MAMALEKEMATFTRELPRLIKEAQGKYALVKDGEIAAVFDTYEDALTAGYGRFGLETFMVKQISALERGQHFTRSIAPCPK